MALKIAFFASADLETPVSSFFIGSGGTPPYVFSLNFTPYNIVLNPNGTFSGISTSPAEQGGLIKLQDSNGFIQKNITIKVFNA